MADDDAARVRSVLARELDTISAYERAARETASPEVRAFLLHLAREEKEHVAEAVALLRRLDPEQEAEFLAPARGLEHFLEGRRAAAPDRLRRPEADPPPGSAPERRDAPRPVPGFTVGSLKPVWAPNRRGEP